MSRRYNCDDYPEHLNPFREENGDEDHVQNKYSTLWRRKSRTVLNLTSWSFFQSIKAKPAKRDDTYFQRSNRTKFMSMTPKISRHFAEMLSSKRSSRPNTSLNTEPVSNRAETFSPSEFRIRPKSSREKFALRPEADRGVEPSPAPLESEVVPVVSRTRSLEHLHTPTSEDSKEFDLSDEGIQCTSHGAKPKKKRQAPLPPPSPTNSAPSDQEEKELPSTPEEHETSVDMDKH